MDWEPHDRHWIRLQGPWEVSWIDNAESQPPARITLPADWRSLFGDRIGTARFSRRFQRPTTLDPDERVCVTLVDLNADVTCHINNAPVTMLKTPLGDPGCWPAEFCVSFDVTDHLRPSNQLTLEIRVKNTPTRPTGLYEPVLLEIVTIDAGDDE